MLQTPLSLDAGSVIQQLTQQFRAVMTTVLLTTDSTVLGIARLAHLSILMISLLHHFTHVQRRLGKYLIKGGVVLTVLSEFVLPVIGRV
ncbi:MAG: hypothetical protein ABSB29_06215 [Nitrososphaerales archaeon]|jgi:hypothetical protein